VFAPPDRCRFDRFNAAWSNSMLKLSFSGMSVIGLVAGMAVSLSFWPVKAQNSSLWTEIERLKLDFQIIDKRLGVLENELHEIQGQGARTDAGIDAGEAEKGTDANVTARKDAGISNRASSDAPRTD
jgi:hypothetical protein